MNVFLIGVGRAGCRIGNLLLSARELKSHTRGLLIDTDKAELEYSGYKYRLLVGEALLDGNGTGKELELGVEVLNSERQYIIEKLTSVKGEVDCFFVISSMGGGTGGAAYTLIEELKRSYEEPVYYAGILPSAEDREDVLSNYASTLKEFVKQSDAFFPIDLDLLKGEKRLRGSYREVDSKVSSYLGDLFEIGTYMSKDEVGGNIVGASEVMNTLGGICTIGVQSFEPSGEEGKIPDLVISMTNEASKNVLLPFELRDAERGLVIVSGPKKYLDFIGSIPARLWVEERIGKKAVLGGDSISTWKKEIEVITVFSQIKKSNRIKELYERGKALEAKLKDEKVVLLIEKIEGMNSKLASLEEDFSKTTAELKEMLKTRKRR